jgi:hypothetical protein
LGFQPITVLTAAVGLTVPNGAAKALVQVESQNVRWRDDGTDPTATVGMLLSAGSILEYDAAQLDRVKFIEVAPSAKLNISYYGISV